VGWSAVLRLPVVLLGVLLATGAPLAAASAAPDGVQQHCGLTVCAQADGRIDVACTQEGPDGDGLATLRCVADVASFVWGRSSLYLSGRIFLGADLLASWSCTQGCELAQHERNVNAYALWSGGPEVPELGLGNQDGGWVPVESLAMVLRAPAGSGACLLWDLSLETTALAETPHLPAGLPGGWLEEVLAGDGAFDEDQACLG
jgi:hypothetical protein